MPIHTVGIDIAKSVFHLVGLDETGSITVKKKFSRAQLLVYTANHLRSGCTAASRSPERNSSANLRCPVLAILTSSGSWHPSTF